MYLVYFSNYWLEYGAFRSKHISVQPLSGIISLPIIDRDISPNSAWRPQLLNQLFSFSPMMAKPFKLQNYCLSSEQSGFLLAFIQQFPPLCSTSLSHSYISHWCQPFSSLKSRVTWSQTDSSSLFSSFSPKESIS